jgi:hypothetical protein
MPSWGIFDKIGLRAVLSSAVAKPARLAIVSLAALSVLGAFSLKAAEAPAIAQSPGGAGPKGVKVAMARGPIDRVSSRDGVAIEGLHSSTSRTPFEMAYVCSLSGAGQTTSCALRTVVP